MKEELFKGDYLAVVMSKPAKASAQVENCTLVLNQFLEDFASDPQRITMSLDTLNVRYCNVVRGLRVTTQSIKCDGTAKVPEFLPMKAMAQAIGAFMADRKGNTPIIGICREKNGKCYLKVLSSVPACYKVPEEKPEVKAKEAVEEEVVESTVPVKDIVSREGLIEALTAVQQRIGDKVLAEYFSKVLKEVSVTAVLVDGKGIVKIA